MIALLIKDWRLNLPATLAWLILFIALPTVSMLVVLMERRGQPVVDPTQIPHAWLVGGGVTLAASTLVIPVFGGIAFARERRDRSANFLASMPVARWRVVASKILMVFLLTALPWAGLAVMLAVRRMVWPAYPYGPDMLDKDFYMVIIHLQIMLLGMAWVLSSILESELLATAGAILLGLILCVGYGVLRDRLSRRGMEGDQLAVMIAIFTTRCIGAAGFIGGTIIALVRTSP